MSIRKGNLVLAAKGVIKAEVKSYVVDNTVATEFDSMADTITLTSDFVDYNGNTVTLGQLAVGDNVIVKQINVPDRYVLSKTTTSVTFGTLETSKIIIPTTVDGMTGGTITAASGDTAVRFKSKSTSSYLGFIDTNNTTLGFLGVNSSKKPVFYDSSEHQLAYTSDIPTKTSDLTDDVGFLKNISYNSANKKLQKTIGSTTSDVVTFGANAFTNTTIPAITSTDVSILEDGLV